MEAIKKLLGKQVIIRADRAGVFYGTLADCEPLGDKWQVELTDCRRLWYWSGAASITQMSVEGVKNPAECKFTIKQQSLVISGVIEIHKCTKTAIESINSVKEWKR